MHQKDFSKIKEMNIHSDVVFANQADRTEYAEYEFDGHKAKMITTATRGVGINRNMALIYATADYCLFADDDVVYYDDAEKKVVSEFEAHPDADIIIFNLDSEDGARKQSYNLKTKKHPRFGRMPWGGCRIAVRMSSVKKANLWFTTLYGGGCVFPSGEDSIFLTEAKKKGMTFYVSKEIVGKVYFGQSTWFTGRDERYFFARGAFYANVHPHSQRIWWLYAALSTKQNCKLTVREKIKWMKIGSRGYREVLGFEQMKERLGIL